MKLGIIVIPQSSVATTTNWPTTTTIIQSLVQYIFSFETNRLQLALQWTVYSIFLCIFHLGEFFSTCIYNPSVTSSDSFMINQSKAYTAAALVCLVCFLLCSCVDGLRYICIVVLSTLMLCSLQLMQRNFFKTKLLSPIILSLSDSNKHIHWLDIDIRYHGLNLQFVYCSSNNTIVQECFILVSFLSC